MCFFLSATLYNFFLDFNFTSVLQYWYKVVSYLIKTYSNLFFIYSCISFLKKSYIHFYLATFMFIKFNFFVDNLIILSIPSQLMIGYNNIHPFLFYFSFICGCLTLIYIRCFYIISIFNIFILATFALLLGGLWGLGNSIWGFFWVNDQIEVILLLYSCVLLMFLHIFIKQENILRLILCFALLTCVIFLLRWGFAFTRHNFFNVKMLVNISAGFFIYFYNIFPVIFLWIVNSIFETIFFLFILYLIIFLITPNVRYKLFLYLFHIFIMILAITWIKYRTNNFVLGTNNKYFIPQSINFANLKIITVFFTFKPLFFKLSFLLLKFQFYISSKLILIPYRVYVSYYFIYWWYIMLISMCKIYIR